MCNCFKLLCFRIMLYFTVDNSHLQKIKTEFHMRNLIKHQCWPRESTLGRNSNVTFKNSISSIYLFIYDLWSKGQWHQGHTRSQNKQTTDEGFKAGHADNVRWNKIELRWSSNKCKFWLFCQGKQKALRELEGSSALGKIFFTIASITTNFWI